MLETNTPAPNFTLADQNGTTRSLDDFRGKYVVVYFYPKGGTPGCIKQACEIRDAYPEFENMGVAVIGISVDKPENNANFAKTYNLPFTLLSDFQQKTARLYGAKGFFFSKRISYLISPHGTVIKTYPAVDPSTHATELIEDIRKELEKAKHKI